MNRSPWLGVARASEVAYAVASLVLALGLPRPPQPTELVVWVHYLGTAVLALVLAWKLARPTPAAWVVALILASYVVLNGLASLVALQRTAAPRGLGTAALGVAGAVIATQLVAAGALLAARRQVFTPTSPT